MVGIRISWIFALACLMGPNFLVAQSHWATGSFNDWGAEPAKEPPGPATSTDLLMVDDGSGDDAAGGDLILSSRIFTLGNTNPQDMNLSPNTQYKWKSAYGDWTTASPEGAGSADMPFLTPGAGGTWQFCKDTNIYADGFLPDSGTSPTASGIIYTSLDAGRIAGASVIEVVGSFQTQLGGTAFDPTTAGAVPLTLNGSYYEGSVTGLANGAYDWIIKLNNDTSNVDDNINRIGTQGTGGDHQFYLKFYVFEPSDTVLFQLDPVKVRSRAHNDNDLAKEGPPFYALSTAWGTDLDASTEMVEISPNLYRKIFVVPFPGEYTARVVQGVGRAFPEAATSDTIGYPFVVTSVDQDIAVYFERNVYSDGYQPDHDFIVVNDYATKWSLNNWARVGVVGNFQADFGGVDWTPDASPFRAFDNGLNGDVIAGDEVYALTLQAFVTSTDRQLRGVAQKVGQSAYRNELGTPTGGLITDGSNVNGLLGYAGDFDYVSGNDYTFQLDAITGRVGTGTTVPERGVFLIYFPGVEDWMMY